MSKDLLAPRTASRSTSAVSPTRRQSFDNSPPPPSSNGLPTSSSFTGLTGIPSSSSFTAGLNVGSDEDVIVFEMVVKRGDGHEYTLEKRFNEFRDLLENFKKEMGKNAKIGRAVQQECRDRSRMPSSA
eukprot:TRINITY_DN70205_c0_g1_i1.p1 TRINITY_DN70205_c0_g1~~TRINITY_DN70205_c0_g1_i1.p1  ORF type:complete len:128 (-),score=9.09 TRINITY_DN70205_c0_g1_i1:27-410(-)